MPVEATISNSSARVCSKCSHRAFESSTPESTSSFLTMGRQPPQVVPAFVQALMAARSQAPSAIAAQIDALGDVVARADAAVVGEGVRAELVASGRDQCTRVARELAADVAA